MENCLVKAFSQALSVPVDEIERLLGHNGYNIEWPTQPKPYCYRGVHIQELIDVAYKLGFYVISLDRVPLMAPSIQVNPIVAIPNYEERLKSYLTKHTAVLVSHLKSHAWCWNGVNICDRYWNTFSLDDYMYSIDEAHLIIKS